MKTMLRNFASGLFGGLVGVLILGATYPNFSPGGALSGTWNSQNVSVGAGAPFITGTLPVANGGTSATTLTGVLQGNGTGAFTAFTSSTVGQIPRVTGANTFAFGALNLSDTDAVTGTLPFGNGGTGLAAAADDTTLVSSGAAWVATGIPNCPDTSGNHLNYIVASNSFACGTSAPGGFTGFANPTALVGLSAINGSAVTAMPSDAAPALNQTISPTWSGLHTFTGSEIMIQTMAATATDYFVNNTASAVDTRLWRHRVNSVGQYQMTALNDARSAGTQALTFDRTTSSVTALTFGNAVSNPTFTFAGSGIITAGGVIRVPDGSTGTPSISFTSDPNTGIYLSAADHIRVVAGGNIGLLIDNPNNDVTLGIDGGTDLRFNALTSATANAGGGIATPATVQTFLSINVNGTFYKIPLYAN